MAGLIIFDTMDVTYERRYLPIDETHDGGFDPHAHREADVHVLMITERLQAREQEHGECE